MTEVNYNQMLECVQKILSQHDNKFQSAKDKIKYDRFMHTRRVLKFVNRIYEALQENEHAQIDYEALVIATIFHDSGYGLMEQQEHAIVSEGICRKYLSDMNYDGDRIEFICSLIKNHSNKQLLKEVGSPLELVLLQEADLLDDTGAHGLVMDIWIEAQEEDPTFESMLQHMKRFTLVTMKNNPMRTDPARCLWDSKKELTEEFIRQYERDLEVD